MTNLVPWNHRQKRIKLHISYPDEKKMLLEQVDRS